MKKVLKTAFKVLLWAVPVLLIAILVSQLAGVRYLCVLSPSMEPELPVGSLVVIVPVKPERVKPGDNLAYLTGGNIVTHRVLLNDTASRTLKTKGIAGKLEDAPVPYEAVLGVEKLCIPKAGRIAAAIKTPAGKAILLTAGALIVLILLIPEFLPGRRRRIAATEPDLTA
ncbi:MAG: signal peptidase I [Clostridia bacterium]|nr:signal peptidase I [Clostridia bacterium]